ncbi:MAG: SMP-30/gluconolactonase/LRE family protein [Paracoccaceae bacterium]|nr:SMP-30/gluconolactonase/LRE family protein [Paracoccaceae bacterium]MDE2914335.1 SMP-30/gluconolactonase/LRE family protein [Paracoccaceae bacterium]
MRVALIDQVSIGAILGESPIWLPDSGVFLWLDLLGRKVHRYDPRKRENVVVADGFSENLACLARLAGGHVLLVTATAFVQLDPASGTTVAIDSPLVPGDDTCFNDGKVAPDGSFWLGTSDVDETDATGSLHRIAGTRVDVVDSGFVISNGPAFAPGGRRAYFADSAGRRILQYELGGAGLPVSRSEFTAVPDADGLPDGLTVDSSGHVFSAHWQGSRITVYGPDGVIRERIRLPARNITSCTFGGHDLSHLLVTSAAIDVGDEADDGEGDIFLFETDCTGVLEPVFAFPHSQT